MAFDDFQVRTIFPIPLVTTKLGDADRLNKLLLGEIAERRSQEEGVTRSNLGGWDSAPDLFARKEPGHAELAGLIDQAVRKASDQLMSGVTAKADMRYDGWVHVGPTGSMRGPHDHAGSFWSGTYYVAVPAAAEGDEQSGAIEFVDPRGSIGTNALIRTPFTEPRFIVRPVAGSLLLWPSFLKHWAHPNRSEEERVTVAFNAWFVAKN